MSNPTLPDRPALGNQFQKAIRVLVLPTGAGSGARLVFNTSQLPPIAEILIFNGTNQLIVHANTGGVIVSQDDQLSSSASVQMRVDDLDSLLPNIRQQPADSVGGSWRPSLHDMLYKANAGSTSEQQVTRWLSAYATPDRAASDRSSIQLQSKSRDGATHSNEVNIRGDITTIENTSGGLQAIVVKPDASGATPVMRIESNKGFFANVAYDLLQVGDANPLFAVDFDGRHHWGPGGAGATDTILFRSAAGVLKTDTDITAATGHFGGSNGPAVYIGDDSILVDVNQSNAFAVEGQQDPTTGRIFFGNGLDANIYRNSANMLGTDSSFSLQVVGRGFLVKEGVNATMGTATLVAGTVVVNTTKVTGNSRIFLTAQTTGAAPGALRVSARTAGTSFTVTSSSATDTSTFAWLIVEPS